MSRGGVEACPPLGTGARAPASMIGLCPSSSRENLVRGRRFGSGFKIICDGMPPCDTIVGGFDDAGKGAKVWRLREAGFERPVRN